MNRIDWSKYLAYFSQIKTRQTPASEDRRTEIEDLLVEVLEISVPDWPRHWGTASGFGNGPEVVVHLHATPRSGPLGNLAAEFTGPLAIRVMRHNIGADTIAFFQQRAEEEHPLNTVAPTTVSTANAVLTVRREAGARVGEIVKIRILSPSFKLGKLYLCWKTNQPDLSSVQLVRHTRGAHHASLRIDSVSCGCLG